VGGCFPERRRKPGNGLVDDRGSRNDGVVECPANVPQDMSGKGLRWRAIIESPDAYKSAHVGYADQSWVTVEENILDPGLGFKSQAQGRYADLDGLKMSVPVHAAWVSVRYG